MISVTDTNITEYSDSNKQFITEYSKIIVTIMKKVRNESKSEQNSEEAIT
jgi:hypothetical protein